MPPANRTLPPETLRAFRHWLGLSQPDVGDILGMSVSGVQDLEREGGPEWVRYALLGWAVVVHGHAPRTAARHLGLPWRHYPAPAGAAPSADDLAQLDALARGGDVTPTAGPASSPIDAGDGAGNGAGDATDSAVPASGLSAREDE